MWKKWVCFILVFSTMLVCLTGVLAAEAEENTNDIVFERNFDDGYNYSWSYSDNADGQSASNSPWFKNIDGKLVFDTEEYKGQAYPIKKADTPSYARANFGDKIQDAGQYQYLYQVELKFERGFSQIVYQLRYGASSWVNGKTKDVTLFDTTADGKLRFGNYSQQLEIGETYGISVLVDVREETRSRTLYINGELISENQSTDIGATPTDIDAKTVFAQALVIRPYQGSGEDYTYLDTKITVDNQRLVRIRNIDAMMVQGEEHLNIPRSGEVTAQYWANTVFANNIAAQWEVTPQGQGVSIDENGLVTISSDAVEGDYQVTATEGTKSAALAIHVEGIKLSISGESRIMLPLNGTYSMIQYKVQDTAGTVYPAEFALAAERDGIYMSQDGTLRIYRPDLSNMEPIQITAQAEGETIKKTVTLATGFFEDFSKTNNWGSVQVATEENGNRYLNANGTRCDSPTISEAADLDVITMEYRYRVGEVARDVSLGGASAYKPDGSVDNGKWWLAFNALQNGDKATVTLKADANKIYNNDVPLQDGNWMKVKYVISCADKTIDLYLDDKPVLTDGSLSKDLFNYRIRIIINYAPIDDIKIYSGVGIEAKKDVKVQIDTASNQPKAGAGGQTTVELAAKVLDADDNEVQGHDITWSVTGAPEGVTLSGQKLLINETAPEAFLIGAEITTAPDTLVQKEICLVDADVYISQKDTMLTFTGKANANFIITVFRPKDTSNMTSSFLASYDKEDAGDSTTFFSQTLQADEAGKATLDMSSYAPGLYKVYAKGSEDGVDNAMNIYHKLQDLFTTNAIENITDPAFKTLLLDYTNQPKATVEAAWNTYQELKRKEETAMLCAKDINDFYIACALMDALDGSAYNKNKTEALTQAYPTYDFTGVKLLEKNIDFGEVVDAAVGKRANNPTQFLADVKEQSILIGLKKLPNVNNAKVFLAELDNAKYNDATAEQKSYIAEQIGNKTYDSLAAVNVAIDALTLPTGGNTGGNTGGSGGGGSGSRPGGSSSRPVESGSIYSINPNTPSNGTSQGIQFTDLGQGHWAYSYIQTLAQKSILNGDGGRFRPEDNLTRAEFVKILMTAFGLPKGENAGFADVSQSDWFAPYVAGAWQAQLVNGTGNNFLPNAAISRQDAVVMAYRFAQAAGKSWQTAAMNFEDGAQIAEYAKEAVSAFASNGIVQGVGGGRFMPEAAVTRAEAAKIVCQIIEGGV